MPRQREHPFSWSCLKLFLDRENLPGLSLGFECGVKGGLLISSRLSLWLVCGSQIYRIFLHAPLQGSLEV